MGDKSAARASRAAAGVPIMPGYDDADQSDGAPRAAAIAIGFPVMIKAAAGGGGRGMRLVRDESELDAALQARALGGRARFRRRAAAVERPRRARAMSRSRSSPTARQRRASRRARLLGPAAPPEGHRGGALAAVDRRSCATTHGRRGRGAARAVGYTTPARSSSCSMPRRPVLLHGDEHAPAGRAPGDRSGHRHRSRRMAVAGRARRALHAPASDCVSRGHAIEVRLCAEDPAEDFLPQAGTMALWIPRGVRTDHALASARRFRRITIR